MKKKFIGMFLSMALVIGELIAIEPNESQAEVELPRAIETEEVQYLTKADFELLYTLQEQPYNDTCITLSVEDANILMKVARQEAGAGFLGQLWEMGVIMNRLNSDEFPNTIYEVVSQSGQFEVFTSGAYIKADVNSYTHLALAFIERGYNPTRGAIYVESSSNSENSWHRRNLEFIAEINGQRFYKKKEK